MSVQTVLNFIQKVNEDENLYIAVKKLNGTDLNTLLKVASEAGYEFSVDDWKGAVRNISGNLSDNDLDQVVGGAVAPMFTMPTVSPALQSFMKPTNPAAMCTIICGVNTKP